MLRLEPPQSIHQDKWYIGTPSLDMEEIQPNSPQENEDEASVDLSRTNNVITQDVQQLQDIVSCLTEREEQIIAENEQLKTQIEEEYRDKSTLLDYIQAGQ